MFWTFMHQGTVKTSWGRPRSIPANEVSDLKPNYDVKVYQGEEIKAGEDIFFSMQGDATLGFGDSIWLISFLRDILTIKVPRRSSLHLATGVDIGNFYKHFLPSSVVWTEEYISKEEFDGFKHVLPAMYYWREIDGGDRSWVDNKSILERLYNLTGVEFRGLPLFEHFTPDAILYPEDAFYQRLRINKGEPYCFFQWHTSGPPKNIPPEQNIELLRHITQNYGLKCYVIGRLRSLDRLEEIEGVRNLNNITLAEDLISLARNADLIVSPDSAGVHLGEAYRVPTVGIMSSLPPSYIASKYQIPAFMYGSGFCPFRPCGYVIELPKDKCPKESPKHYCNVLTKIDLNLFDKCVEKTRNNRRIWRSSPGQDFYESENQPLVMEL